MTTRLSTITVAPLSLGGARRHATRSTRTVVRAAALGDVGAPARCGVGAPPVRQHRWAREAQEGGDRRGGVRGGGGRAARSLALWHGDDASVRRPNAADSHQWPTVADDSSQPSPQSRGPTSHVTINL